MVGVSLVIFVGFGMSSTQTNAIDSVQAAITGIVAWSADAETVVQDALLLPPQVETIATEISIRVESFIIEVGGVQELVSAAEEMNTSLTLMLEQYSELTVNLGSVNDTVTGLGTAVTDGGDAGIALLTKYDVLRRQASKVQYPPPHTHTHTHTCTTP
jgi:hypothetical protein